VAIFSMQLHVSPPFLSYAHAFGFACIFYAFTLLAGQPGERRLTRVLLPVPYIICGYDLIHLLLRNCHAFEDRRLHAHRSFRARTGDQSLMISISALARLWPKAMVR
jgi:hypothetical protein